MFLYNLVKVCLALYKCPKITCKENVCIKPGCDLRQYIHKTSTYRKDCFISQQKVGDIIYVEIAGKVNCLFSYKNKMESL